MKRLIRGGSQNWGIHKLQIVILMEYQERSNRFRSTEHSLELAILRKKNRIVRAQGTQSYLKIDEVF